MQTPAPSATPFPPVEGLKDIVVPAPVPWLPRTAGWYILLALLGALAFGRIRPTAAGGTANLYRRQALVELDGLRVALDKPGGRHQVAARLPELLKRVALHLEPRSAVASLSGAEWLAELDRLYGGSGFTKGPGRLLPKLAYGADHVRLGSAPRRDRRSHAPQPGVDPEAPEAGMTDLLARAAKVLSFPVGDSSVELAAPWALVLLAVPFIVSAKLPAYKERQPALRVPFFERLAAGLDRKPEPGAVVLRRIVLQWVLAPLVFVLLVAAAARPELVLPPIQKTESARDLLLAVDISSSMNTRDFTDPQGQKIERLDAVKLVLHDFIARREGDRIGLLVFGEAPHLQAPFTLDHDLCRELLREVQVGMAGPRTMIGDAIGLAIKLFEESPAKQKVVVLLTDGNDTGSRVPPTKAAEIAKSDGITIHTVGIGDPGHQGRRHRGRRHARGDRAGHGRRHVHGARPRRARGHLPEARRDREGRAEDGELPAEASALPLAPGGGDGAAHALLPGHDGVPRAAGGARVMPGALAEFHFLRPEWLWLVLPAGLVVWVILRAEDPVRPFRKLVAPHLLSHLLVGQGGRFRVRPAHLVVAFLAASIFALAGPSWQREVPPFSQDKASLVVALDLSRSMDAIDVSPSRLERAKQKVRDLLALREGARTALVAYAGTAHTVLPLTEDSKILEVYLEALATSLMPVPGKNAPAALELAESLLAKEPVPGTILFVTDGIAAAQVPAFVAHRQKSPNQVVALGVGTSEGGPIREGKGFLTEGGHRVVAKLDKEGLQTLSRDAGAFVATATLDDSDVSRIQRGIQTHLQTVVQKDQSARYRDFGWYLAPFLALHGRALVPAGVDHSVGHHCRRRPGQRASRGRRLARRRPLGDTRPAGTVLLRARRLPDRGGAFRESRVEGSRVLPGRRLRVRGGRLRPRGHPRSLVRPRQRLRQDRGAEAGAGRVRQGPRGPAGMAGGEGQPRSRGQPHPPGEKGRGKGRCRGPEPEARRGEVRRERQEGQAGSGRGATAYRRADRPDVAARSPDVTCRLPPPEIRRASPAESAPSGAADAVTKRLRPFVVAWPRAMSRSNAAFAALWMASLLGFPATLRAQGKALAYTSLNPKAVTVGQPVILTVDVFVPTYFTGAPRFPQLDVKDAMVVFVDEGQNLTESVGEVTYAGQRRSYRIYPQREGAFEVPSFEVKVSYAVDGKASPRFSASGRGGSFTATVPEAARRLEHFIATPSFQLTESTDRPLEGLVVGDSITRTITMTAVEAFAMMLPPLSFPPVDGLGVYPRGSRRVSDSSGERGAARVGKRVESVTYSCEKEGHYRLPAIDIDWWDTVARTVRRASLPELALSVAANPDLKAEIPLPEDPSEKPPPPDPWKPLREALRRYGPLAAVLVLSLALLLRIFRARIRALREQHEARRLEREESAAAYLERLRKAALAGPTELLAATYRWLDRRGDTSAAARLDRFAKESGDPALPGLADALVVSALAEGGSAGPSDGSSSRRFVEALIHTETKAKSKSPALQALEPLNPR